MSTMQTLNHWKNKVRSKEQGFTLIELLVVILIIGILAAIAIAIFMSQRTSAVEATLKSDLHNAGTLYQGSYKNNKGYDESVLLQMPKSKGNSIAVSTVTPLKEGFCLTGSNESLRDTIFYYNSNDGGVTDNAGSCLGTAGSDDDSGSNVTQCSALASEYVRTNKEFSMFEVENPRGYSLMTVEENLLPPAQKTEYEAFQVEYKKKSDAMLQAQDNLFASSEETQEITKHAIRVSQSESFANFNAKISEYQLEVANINEAFEFNNPSQIAQLQSELRPITEIYYDEWC